MAKIVALGYRVVSHYVWRMARFQRNGGAPQSLRDYPCLQTNGTVSKRHRSHEGESVAQLGEKLSSSGKW